MEDRGASGPSTALLLGPRRGARQHFSRLWPAGGQTQPSAGDKVLPVTWSCGVRAPRAFLPLYTLFDDKPGIRVILALAGPQRSHCPDRRAAPLDDDEDTATQQEPDPATGPDLVAIKVYELSRPESKAQAHGELRMMRRVWRSAPGGGLSHVVTPLLAMEDAGHMYLVMPYMDGGDLFQRVDQAQSEGGVPVTEARRLLAQIVQGLLELKRCGVAHGDVSLENVMLQLPREGGKEPTAHLIDLGSACIARRDGRCPAGEYHYKGKLGYIPPEVVSGSPSGHVDPFAVDVWALGVCTYALLTGRPLYLAPEGAAFALLCQGRVDELVAHYEKFGLVLGQSAARLVCAMLRPAPEERPTLEAIAEHPFFAEIGECL